MPSVKAAWYGDVRLAGTVSRSIFWPVPNVDDLPDISVENWTKKEGFRPYLRDPQTLARPWAIPGTPGLEHRIGGLEKAESVAKKILLRDKAWGEKLLSKVAAKKK